MKKILAILAMLCIGAKGFSQQDSTAQKNDSYNNHKKKWQHMMEQHGMDSSDCMNYMGHWPMPPHHWGNNHAKPSNLTTNWLIIDLGFTNYNDKTNYAGAEAQAFAPGSSSDWFKLKNNKSVDVNIWFFMQRLNMVKHIVNLKYGLGIELNNYRYQDNIKFVEGSGVPAHVIMDTISYSKNKLAADYITVPLMVNFNFTPGLKEGFGLSVGVSAGYLYSSRQKTISDEFGKHKTFDDYNLDPWKISWIAEAQLGPIKLYGSLATKSMFGKGLVQTPYTFGIRLSN